MKEMIHVSWAEYQNMIHSILERIKSDNIKFDGVYGLPRGGLPMAVHFSHLLDLPLLAHPTLDSLLVDDISDTGKALDGLKNKKIACLYSSDWTITIPDYFVRKKTNQNSWIVFPWENKDLLSCVFIDYK